MDLSAVGGTTRRLTLTPSCILYHTEPGGWVGWYTRVPGLDELIDVGRSTVDKEKRLATYAKIQHLLKEEAPSIFLFHQHDMLGIT